MHEQLHLHSVIACFTTTVLWPVKTSEEQREGSTCVMTERMESLGSVQACGGHVWQRKKRTQLLYITGTLFAGVASYTLTVVFASSQGRKQSVSSHSGLP